MKTLTTTRTAGLRLLVILTTLVVLLMSIGGQGETGVQGSEGPQGPLGEQGAAGPLPSEQQLIDLIEVVVSHQAIRFERRCRPQTGSGGVDAVDSTSHR